MRKHTPDCIPPDEVGARGVCVCPDTEPVCETCGGDKVIERKTHDSERYDVPCPDCQPAPAAAVEIVSADEIGNQHPTNRYLFKRLCAHFGIELGKDRIADALNKIDQCHADREALRAEKAGLIRDVKHYLAKCEALAARVAQLEEELEGTNEFNAADSGGYTAVIEERDRRIAALEARLDELIGLAFYHWQGMRGDSREMQALSKAQMLLSAATAEDATHNQESVT